MSSLHKRLEVLEKKMFTDDANLPSCILITTESGRLDAVIDESEIIKLTSDGITYDRKSQELEEDFVLRVAEFSRAKLPAKGVPVLIAQTEKMIKC